MDRLTDGDKDFLITQLREQNRKMKEMLKISKDRLFHDKMCNWVISRKSSSYSPCDCGTYELKKNIEEILK